ncbi:MAG: DUF21 domain-containing protein [Phycisphaerales bacterium]|nr:MAG: DUF21 domain-containing protein [Phycisphaerales bacterium]
MSTTETVMWLLLALVGFAGSALCSGLETGLYRINRVRLAVRAAGEPPDVRARSLQRELERPDRLLASLLIGNNLFNYFGTVGVTALLGVFGFGEIAVIVLSALVITPLLLIFAESLPKEVFRLSSDRLTPRLTPFLVWSRRLYTGVGALPLVVGFGRWASRVVGADPSATVSDSPRERVAALLQESAGDGSITAAQSTLADRALRMGRLTVEEEMVAWRRVRTVPAGLDRERLLDRLASMPYARAPVLDRRGRVVGVLRHADLWLFPDEPIEALIREPARLNGSEPLRVALLQTVASPARCAIIERGRVPLGFATPKDLVEPLTGELPAW